MASGTFVSTKSASRSAVVPASDVDVVATMRDVKLRAKVASAAEALGSKSKAAKYLGVSRGQPGKWMSGEERPNAAARRMIQDLDYVWDRLIDERAPESAAIWLRSPNAFLNGATPLVWLRTRGPEDVVGAIDAEDAGSFA